MIAYRANFTVFLPKAVRTFHDYGIISMGTFAVVTIELRRRKGRGERGGKTIVLRRRRRGRGERGGKTIELRRRRRGRGGKRRENNRIEGRRRRGKQ